MLNIATITNNKVMIIRITKNGINALRFVFIKPIRTIIQFARNIIVVKPKSIGKATVTTLRTVSR